MTSRSYPEEKNYILIFVRKLSQISHRSNIFQFWWVGQIESDVSILSSGKMSRCLSTCTSHPSLSFAHRKMSQFDRFIQFEQIGTLFLHFEPQLLRKCRNYIILRDDISDISGHSMNFIFLLTFLKEGFYNMNLMNSNNFPFSLQSCHH